MDKDGRYQAAKEDDSNKSSGPSENAAGLKIGKTATPELKAFVAAFEPLCGSDESGEAARKEGFTLADPNGNGLCSLAELEGFVLKTLLAAYPKKGRDEPDKGRDLWDAFRPCYIRAFNDAKDYKADTGAKIKGTKKATDDDFVSVEEFKLFCVYLILYAAMFDAFAKIDGGGAGRSKDDDKRIVLDEFLAGDAFCMHASKCIEVKEKRIEFTFVCFLNFWLIFSMLTYANKYNIFRLQGSDRARVLGSAEPQNPQRGHVLVQCYGRQRWRRGAIGRMVRVHQSC